jgi:RHS repeat-associated protein
VSNSLFGDKNYEYDPLDQMIREGNKTYHFDSLGNPANSSVNDLNQIISTDRSSFSYDLNGNLRQKSGDQEQIDYKFDPRGRLTEITHPQQKQVRYFYDPLSRLFSKETYHYLDGYWQKQKKIFYLYDRDKEIGTMDEQGNLLELKVLGIGIKGDIGAAVAVEIGSTIYAPLHDFSGHIIALLSQEGQLVETYDIDAFGQEKSPISPISCWRFCSKRSEEGLIFFGLRFYDPSLGRWLTPDPAGFVDGVNLYAYVNNSPINRLDLFGLAGEDPHNLTPLQFNINISSLPESNQLLRCKILEGGAYTDYVVSCGYWHQLNFTPQEIENNSFNLFGHSEIMPSDGRIGLVSYRHGINTKFPEFFAACKSITDQLPGTLFIGRYHGTEGFTTDSLLTTVELQHIETKEVCKTRQFLLNCSELCKINPAISEGSAAMQSLWAHFNHSRGGLIDLRALQGMPYKQKQNLQTQLLLTSIAPAKPISRDFGLEVANYYSEHDLVTGAFGAPDVAMSLVGRCIGSRFGGKLGGSIGSSLGGFIGSYFFGHEDCDIRFVPCTSKWSERSFGIADHAILGGTYRGVVSGSIKQYNKDYGFYDEKNR